MRQKELTDKSESYMMQNGSLADKRKVTGSEGKPHTQKSLCITKTIPALHLASVFADDKGCESVWNSKSTDSRAGICRLLQRAGMDAGAGCDKAVRHVYRE